MNRFPIALGVALGFLLVISFLLDAANVGQGGAVDLRNRVTGSRLLAAGINPYTYKWSRSEPEIYCDPYNNPNFPVSRTTASPALLALWTPLAAMPYRTGQYVWFLLQWALLIGTGVLWWTRCTLPWQRILLSIVFTAFTFTVSWRLHVERGQSYVLLLFLFSLWSTGTLEKQAGAWRFVAGLAAGLLITMRPPFLLLAPLLAWRWRGQWAGLAAGLALGIVVPLCFKVGIWQDYASAMQIFSDTYRNNFNPAPGRQTFPASVEGLPTDTLALYVPISFSDFSIHYLLRQWGLEPFPALPILLAAAVVMAAWFYAFRRASAPILLLHAGVAMFLFDLLLPAYRNSYNDVVALDFIALGILAGPSLRSSPGLIAALLALTSGCAVYLLSPETPLLIDTPQILLVISGVLLVGQSAWNSTGRRDPGTT